MPVVFGQRQRAVFGAVAVACFAAMSCAPDGADAGPAASAPPTSSPFVTETTATPATPTSAAMPTTTAHAAATTTTSAPPAPPASQAPSTTAPVPTTTAPSAESVEPVTELDFRVNPPSHDDTAPPEWEIGVNVAAGLWQWSDASASHCVYIVVAPASGDPESPSIGLTVNSFRYFDAREPVALLDGEVIVGYNETDDFSGIISGTTYPDCFLERVAEHQGPTEELFAERYSDLDEGYGDASGESSEWACRAHSGPEPADRLDWEHTSDTPHPEVSCEVGVGILPGWWQWSEEIRG